MRTVVGWPTSVCTSGKISESRRCRQASGFEFANGFFRDQSIWPEELKFRRADVLFLEFNVHYGEDAVAFARAGTAGQLAIGDDVVGGQSIAAFDWNDMRAPLPPLGRKCVNAERFHSFT